MDLQKCACVLALALSVCVAANLKDCLMATNKNGTARMEIDPIVVETHSGCEHRLYDKDGHFIADADVSGVTYHVCLPVIQWKISCDDRTKEPELSRLTNNLEFCFECVNDTSPDSQSQSSAGASELWLVFLIPGAAVVGLAIWLVIRWRKGKNQRACKEDQKMSVI